KFLIKSKEEIITVHGDAVEIKPDGVASPVIFDEKKLGSS
ncbi:hypothetical protein Tco_0048275, partial [Tanacetum coccineum]